MFPGPVVDFDDKCSDEHAAVQQKYSQKKRMRITSALLFFAAATPAIAQVGQGIIECEKFFGVNIHERENWKDPRLTDVMLRPLKGPAPTVICVFDEDRRCIAVTYMTTRPSIGLINSAKKHNGGDWVNQNSGKLIAVRKDRSYAMWKEDGEYGYLTVCSERYARLKGFIK